jgi:hypothetical protein
VILERHASVEMMAGVAHSLIAFSADLQQGVSFKEIQTQRLGLSVGQFRERRAYDLSGEEFSVARSGPISGSATRVAMSI